MRIKANKVNVYLSIDGSDMVVVGLATSVAVNASREMVEVAGDDAHSRKYVPGRYGYTVQIDGLFSLGDPKAYAMALTDGSHVRFVISKRAEVTDLPEHRNECFSGEGYVSDYSMTAAVEGYATMSMTIQGSGALGVEM